VQLLLSVQSFVETGGVKVCEFRLKVARATKNPQKMGRKLLTEFCTPMELQECGCVPSTKNKRPAANTEKLNALLDTARGHLEYRVTTCMFYVFIFSTHEVRAIFPGGWDELTMLKRLNQGFDVPSMDMFFFLFAMIFSFLSVNIDYMHHIHAWTKIS